MRRDTEQQWKKYVNVCLCTCKAYLSNAAVAEEKAEKQDEVGHKYK